MRMRRNTKLPVGWVKLRNRILARDNYLCRLCGRTGANSVDHIWPRSKGGTHDEWNLQAAHMVCNRRKYNSTRKVIQPRRSRFA
ncbi:MAG: HNH endonuclease [Chloroflexi bacterium]|nr:MAG: HNH endonuclease [Chloroflexota bacterium]